MEFKMIDEKVQITMELEDLPKLLYACEDAGEVYASNGEDDSNDPIWDNEVGNMMIQMGRGIKAFLKANDIPFVDEDDE